MCDVVVFFFKPNTAYVLRISDLSSDVCSSDLFVQVGQGVQLPGQLDQAIELVGRQAGAGHVAELVFHVVGRDRVLGAAQPVQDPVRSEARRVGEEGVRTWRSRWWQDHGKRQRDQSQQD